MELLPWYLSSYETMLLWKSILFKVNKYLLAICLNTHLFPFFFVVMRCTSSYFLVLL